MVSTARWLESFVRAVCERDPARIAFRASSRDDASTLRSVDALTRALEPVYPQASFVRGLAAKLATLCDRDGCLPEARREEASRLVAMLESALQ